MAFKAIFLTLAFVLLLPALITEQRASATSLSGESPVDTAEKAQHFVRRAPTEPQHGFRHTFMTKGSLIPRQDEVNVTYNASAPACVGEVLTNYIRGFDYKQRTAVWEGWVSVLCNQAVDVDKIIKLSNVQSDDGELKSSEQSAVLTEPPPGWAPEYNNYRYFSSKQVRSPIGIEFNLRYFPYDRIWVPVILLAQQDTSKLKYEFDTVDEEPWAGFSADFYLFSDPGFYVNEPPFKDPVLISLPSSPFSPNNGLLYAQTTIWFSFMRNDYTNFVQGAALFVVVLNMNTLSSFLGSPATMTLGDYINLVTLAFIGIIFLTSIFEKWLLVRQRRVAKDMLTATARATERMKGDAEAAMHAVENTTPAKKRFCGGCFTALKVDDRGVPIDEEDYAHAVQRISWILAVVCLACYIAINIGLLVGYRPPAEPTVYPLVGA